jgi:hypothetical protein
MRRNCVTYTRQLVESRKLQRTIHASRMRYTRAVIISKYRFMSTAMFGFGFRNET